jgi:hypothetical protein
MTEPAISNAHGGGAPPGPTATRIVRDGIEQELLTDPCLWVRRACQIADYGAPTETQRQTEIPDA